MTEPSSHQLHDIERRLCAEAAEIAELCVIAECRWHAAGFVGRGLSAEEVRAILVRRAALVHDIRAVGSGQRGSHASSHEGRRLK